MIPVSRTAEMLKKIMDSNFKNSEAVIVRYTHIPLIFSVFFWSFDIFVYFSPRFIHFYTGDGRNKENST